MGSVITYNDCPRCKTEEGLFEDYYYKSGEIYSFCKHCGYTDNHFIKKIMEGDDIGKYIPNPDPDSKDGKWLWIHEKKEPWGTYYVMPKEGAGTLGAFEEKPDIDKFIKDVNESPVELVEAWISHWDGESISKIIILEEEEKDG